MTVDTVTKSDAATAGLAVTVLIGVTFCLIWSSAFSVAKILLLYAPPFTVLAVRFFVATLLAGGIALALGQRIPATRAAWRQIVVLGLCQNTFYLGLYFWAMTRIPAGLAAIVASTLPLVVAVLAVIVLKERIGRVKAAGLAIGFAGVVAIMAHRVTGGLDLPGLAMAVAGTLALSVATITVKRTDFGTGLLMVVACQMLVGGVGCLAVALVLEDMTALEITTPAVVAFLYQVIFPGIVATFLWFMLLKRITAAAASSFHFLNPIFGVAFAVVLLGERFTVVDAVGIVLVAMGILIVNRPQPAPMPPRA